MKIAVIDTSESLFKRMELSSFSTVDFENILCKKDESLYQIADNVAKRKDIVACIINIEALFENANRADYKGIELIFWLRIKHNFGKFIIVTAFQSIRQILKLHPNYSVINAQNTYFQDVLSGFTALNCIDSVTPLSQEQIRTEYLQHARNLFNLEQIRHEEANWFGIKALWDTHNIRLYGNFKKPYPESVEKHLRTINNLLASFIYKSRQPRVDEIIEMARKELYERKELWIKRKEKWQQRQKQRAENDGGLDSLKSDINEINKEIIEYNELIQNEQREINNLNDNLNNPNFTQPLLDAGQRRSIDNMQEQLKDRRQFEKNLNVEKNILENKLSESLTRLREREQSFNAEDTDSDCPEEFTETLQDTLTNVHGYSFQDLRNNSDGILLLIDDLAEEGWKDAYKIVLDNKINIQTLDEKNYTNGIETLLQAISDFLFLNIQTIICVFLDMRLFREDNHTKSIKEQTGYKILQNIKQEFPFIPVVITTASNKIWTYTETKAIGADAYWNKEGIDNYFRLEESIRNYDDLKKIVFKFSSDKYKVLKKLGDTLQILKNPNKQFWWEEITWEYPTDGIVNFTPIPKNTKVEKDDVINLFIEGIDLYTNYLNHKNDKISDSVYLNSLVVHFGKVIELLHQISVVRVRDLSSGKIIRARKDNTGAMLYEKRNKIAHLGENMTYIDFQLFVHNFLRYITSEQLKVTPTLKVILKKTKTDKKQVEKDTNMPESVQEASQEVSEREYDVELSKAVIVEPAIGFDARREGTQQLQNLVNTTESLEKEIEIIQTGTEPAINSDAHPEISTKTTKKTVKLYRELKNRLKYYFKL